MKVSLVFTLIALFLTPLTYADYWVSVASFQSRDNAEAGFLKAQSSSSENFAVIASETASGFFYRIAAGPYGSLAEAKDPMLILRQLGYRSAWIWQGQSEAAARMGDGTQSFVDEQYSVDRFIQQDDDFFSDDDFFDDDLDVLFSDSADAADEIVTDLPDQLAPAPVDYQLNKLRRD
jgi:hypothetical protein